MMKVLYCDEKCNKQIVMHDSYMMKVLSKHKLLEIKENCHSLEKLYKR